MQRAGFLFLAFALAVTVVGAAATGAVAKDTPRISPEVLKALLDNPEVTVIDVRRGKDYDGSSSKIRGAVRESEKDISWAGKYPKDRFLVLYHDLPRKRKHSFPEWCLSKQMQLTFLTVSFPCSPFF